MNNKITFWVAVLWLVLSSSIMFFRNNSLNQKILKLEQDLEEQEKLHSFYNLKLNNIKEEFFIKLEEKIKSKNQKIKEFYNDIPNTLSLLKDSINKVKTDIETRKEKKLFETIQNVKKVIHASTSLSQKEIEFFQKQLNELYIIVEKYQKKHREYKLCKKRGVIRDFKKDPVLIITVGENPSVRKPVNANQNDPCPVPCEYIGHTQENELLVDGYLLSQGAKRCPYQKTAHLTMENVKLSGFDIIMDTRLDSDVPAGYYSWTGVNFWKKPMNKTMKALSSAYISNCNAASGRDNIVLDLQKYGVTIDSYGRCNKNVHDPETEPKSIRMGRYKFYLAFENSITEDYVTEKYFQALETGTLPVYLGAPNIRAYEPQPGSILHVPDYKNTLELAKHLLGLANNTKEYEKYFIWKKIGPSDSFKALIDISSIHSYCRLCLKVADLYVNEFGKPETHPTSIFVRERLTFYFKKIELGEDKTLKNLKDQILLAFKDHVPIWASQRPGYKKEELKIYRIHQAFVKMKESLFGFAYDSDEKVSRLKGGDKIEVIFV